MPLIFDRILCDVPCRSVAINILSIGLSCFAECNALIRWPKTGFDTCVSFTFFSKTLDSLVAKHGSKQVNNTNFGF